MSRELFVGGVRISDDSDCFVIAEIGHNHQGNVETCKKLFVAAKEAGFSAVKLQKRDNRSLYTQAVYDQPYHSENAFGGTYGSHREALEFGWDQYAELQQFAKELDILFFATAFDEASADFLVELDVPAIKIASGDLRSVQLLEYVARLGRPMFVSTGGADMADVERAYDTIMPINPSLCLLQCTAAYPPEWADLDLGVIETFRRRFPDVVIGFSSHDSGIAMAAVAFALGARVVEKHFTLNRAMRGTDHAFSLEPTGGRKLVRDLRRAREAMACSTKRMHPVEGMAIAKMGKKLVAASDLPAGHVLTREDIAIKSPGDGMWPYQLPEVVGCALSKALSAEDDISPAVLASQGTP